jgi:RecB family exonuclease
VRTFKRCRRKWYLSQYRRLAPIREEKVGAAALGTRLHDAMEILYDPAGGLENALAFIEGAALADAELYPEDAAQIMKDLEMVKTMVEGYVEWAAEEGADEDFEVLAVEEAVEVEMPGMPGVVLLGKLDQRGILRSTGEHMFRDWKSVPDFARVSQLHQDEQLLHYMLLLRLAAKQGLIELPENAYPNGGIYAMLKKSKRTARAKPPFYRHEIVRHTDETVRTYFRRLWAEIQDILDLEDKLNAGGEPATLAYPNPTRDCHWDCDFRAVCPLFDNGGDVEAVLESAYEVRAPLARYNGQDDGGDDS